MRTANPSFQALQFLTILLLFDTDIQLLTYYVYLNDWLLFLRLLMCNGWLTLMTRLFFRWRSVRGLLWGAVTVLLSMLDVGWGRHETWLTCSIYLRAWIITVKVDSGYAWTATTKLHSRARKLNIAYIQCWSRRGWIWTCLAVNRDFAFSMESFILSPRWTFAVFIGYYWWHCFWG